VPEEVDNNALAAAAQEAMRRIASYSVGLVRLLDDDIEPLGSGTLIRIGKVAGILTASHVWDTVVALKLTRVGFYLFPSRRREIQSGVEAIALLDELIIEHKPYDECGPDIAFIKLSASKVATLEQHGTFLNIDRHWNTLVAQSSDDNYHVDAIAGLVAMWGKTVSTQGKAKVIRPEGLTNIGNATRIEDGRDGFDRFEFTPKPEEGLELPSSYGGTSGGGLFRVYLQDNHVTTIALMGLAFFETAIDGKADRIICHGPGSIYDKLAPMIRERWKNKV
jgi:hypothetical protein